MKNFRILFMRSLLPLSITTAIAVFVPSCDKAENAPAAIPAEPEAPMQASLTPEGIARMLASLPLTMTQVQEVRGAVNSSIADGYDEEYTFRDLVQSPGRGVGAVDTRSVPCPETLVEMINEYGSPATRSDSFLSRLAESGMQIYWPYSEDWDGSTMPVITFDPENSSESNTGFLRTQAADGSWEVREISVNEDYARVHPVWVVNWNDDAEFLTPQMMEKLSMTASRSAAARYSSDDFKTLVLKEFKAHRNYDSWFSGGSEFLVKCGAIEDFKAATEEEMKDYNPKITDFMIKVRRKQVGKAIRLNSVLVSEWTSQLSESAFLVIEDDGGKMTKWSAVGAVKIKSRTYGFEVEFPYHRSDDIVWRGKLSDNFLTKYNDRPSRFGDVSITFDFK